MTEHRWKRARDLAESHGRINLLAQNTKNGKFYTIGEMHKSRIYPELHPYSLKRGITQLKF
ncbi:MAG: hypothetical protein B0A82_16830 [Alkalinema sp. CACIAM 70d]|nr:MAG: hypothetical protein B0A82_16830 [Alkalinema sp. CACIAM 70d]